MSLITEHVLRDLLTLTITLLVFACAYLKWAQTHWHRKGIPYLPPSFPFGNLRNPVTQTTSQVVQFSNWYRDLKNKGHDYGGVYLFAAAMFMPVHPELVRSVLVRDFQCFVDRGFYMNEREDPLSLHLLSLEGHKWKQLRGKLTPTFTSGKMKMMFDTLIESSKPMVEELEHSATVNMKDVFAKYTTDAIGSCAFGLDCNSFKDKNSAFREYAERALRDTPFTLLKGLFVFSFPSLAKTMRMTVTKPGVTEFFSGLVQETVKARQQGTNDRKDFMQLLIELKKRRDAGDSDGITLDELTAQAYIFFLAGFETSSTTGTFCLYELAENPRVQAKVREEVRRVLGEHGGELTYEAVQEMKYLGQVVDETLRKYPPLSFLNRICTSEYRIPGTQTVLEKGTRVLVSVWGLQRDPEYFPDPDEFVPERFSEENRGKIVPFTYLPFGEGPRVCIGLRFGVMQTKVGLAALLKNYDFTVSEKTERPLEMDPRNFILEPKGGIWLDVQKVHQ